MNVLQNLMELYNSLPIDSTYRAVAKGILENLREMTDMTIYEAAEMSNSSRTTVWRMVQKMGYKNYTDFRVALKAAVTQFNYYNRLIVIEDTEKKSQIVPSLIARLRNDCEIAQKYISFQLLDELVEKIYQAERICFYLPYRMYAIYSFQQNLAMTGKKTSYFCLLPDMLEDVESVDENSLIICGTIEFAETLDLSSMFVRAKERGAKVILASNHTSRYSRYADQLLFEFDRKREVQFSENTVFELLILAASEMYREKYI